MRRTQSEGDFNKLHPLMFNTKEAAMDSTTPTHPDLSELEESPISEKPLKPSRSSKFKAANSRKK